MIKLLTPMIQVPFVFLVEDRSLFYKAGAWLRDHWSEITSYLSDPSNLVLLGVAAVAAAMAGGLTIRLGARCFYRTCQALNPQPGTITVGRRRMGALDVVLDPPVRLPFKERCMHAQVIGPTRQGKTTLFESWGEQDLGEGHTAFVLATGGDFGEKILRVARTMGVPISYFNPVDADAAKWNPLATGLGNDVARVAEQAVATLEAVSVSSDPYYESINVTMLRRMIYAAEAFAVSEGGESGMALVKGFLEDDEFLKEALRVSLSGKRPKVGLENLDEPTRLWFESRYLVWNSEQRQKNTSGLYMLLDEMLGREAVADALAPRPGERRIDLTDALSRGGLILFDIPAAKVGPLASLVLALFVLQRFQWETLDRVGPQRPVCAFFDEIHTILGGSDTRAAKSFAQWLPQVGKYGVAAHLAYQGLKMLPEDLQHIMLQNASNKFFSGRLAPEDARVAQQLMGTVETEVDETCRTGSSLWSPGQITTISRVSEKPRYSIEEIRRLTRGHWLCSLTKGGNLQDPVILKAQKPKKPRRKG